MHRRSGASCPTSPSGPSDTGVTKVQVTGLHRDLADEDLESYFETPRSGGRKGSVISCSVEEGGTAYIEFDSPEGWWDGSTMLKYMYFIRLSSCTI